ncbi:hypothetical protein KY284_013113 [Solanum tuberosum]|nr:hypothetical protein KY284_013113 [Solanum tuberosum]
MFLPRFSGNDNGNPNNWIFWAELYFIYLGFDEKDWLPLPSFYFDGEALSWFDWLFRNKLLVDWNHFKDAFTQRFQQQANINVLGRLANFSQVHYDYVSSVPIVSQSVVVSPFPVSSHFSKSSAIASTYNTGSSQADQVFDESSHHIEDPVYEFDMAFDLVEDNSMGLQMPLQVTEVLSTPTWCVEIDYRGDMHSRKSNVAEDECLETNTDIVFGGSLHRNESDLQGQFANLKLVVTENSVFHEILSSDFDAPIGVAGEISLIPRDDDGEIAESYPCLFNQSFFADFGALAIESMTDDLPTCYWFDTGQYVSQSITFVFRRKTCGDHLSATDFDKDGYLPIIGAQGGDVQFFAIICPSCYSSGDDSKTTCEGAFHNWLLDMLASYVLAIGSGNSMVHQGSDTISNEAWKVSNVMFTLLLVWVLVETPNETRTAQQLHLTDREYLFISFGSREPMVSTSQSTHALPMRYFDANSLCRGFSRQKTDLVEFDEMYVDIIFLKLAIIEDLYLDKLLFENKGGVSKSEIQSYDVRNDVKQKQINEGIRHAECFFPMDDGVNLFIVKLGGTVKVNCVWDSGISSKTMHQNGLMETTEAHLLLEFIEITSRLFSYFYDAHLKESTQSKERRKTTLRVDHTHTSVCPIININCMCGFECIYVAGIVTFKWVKVVQSTQLLLSEAIGEEHAIYIVIVLNLEDKVLIEDESIVMNQPQPNRDTNKDITQIDIGPSKSNRARPSQRIVWDPGPFTLC